MLNKISKSIAGALERLSGWMHNMTAPDAIKDNAKLVNDLMQEVERLYNMTDDLSAENAALESELDHSQSMLLDAYDDIIALTEDDGDDEDD